MVSSSSSFGAEDFDGALFVGKRHIGAIIVQKSWFDKSNFHDVEVEKTLLILQNLRMRRIQGTEGEAAASSACPPLAWLSRRVKNMVFFNHWENELKKGTGLH
jgi:hypothetical protein